MHRLFLTDERGAVTTDWVALGAGILLLAIIVVYSVMEDSAGYLLDEFEQLNSEYDSLAADVVASGGQIDMNR